MRASGEACPRRVHTTGSCPAARLESGACTTMNRDDVAGAALWGMSGAPTRSAAAVDHYPQHVGDAVAEDALTAVVPRLVLAPAVEDCRHGQGAQAAVDRLHGCDSLGRDASGSVRYQNLAHSAG